MALPPQSTPVKSANIKRFVIEADLQCELDDIPLSIHSSGGVIVVRVESRKEARKLLLSSRRFSGLRQIAGQINDGLDLVSHRLEVHVEDTTVLAMGHGIESGFLRIVGFKKTKVWPLRLL